jgi:hypothetical protein
MGIGLTRSLGTPTPFLHPIKRFLKDIEVAGVADLLATLSIHLGCGHVIR